MLNWMLFPFLILRVSFTSLIFTIFKVNYETIYISSTLPSSQTAEYDSFRRDLECARQNLRCASVQTYLTKITSGQVFRLSPKECVQNLLTNI